MIEVVVQPRRLVAGQLTPLVVRLTNTGQGSCWNVACRLRLPLSVMRLRGGEWIEVERLGPGETVEHVLQVRGRTVGTGKLTSTSFSCRDDSGVVTAVPDMAAELTVVAAAPATVEPDPEFTVAVDNADMPHEQWEELTGRVVNGDGATLRNAVIRLTGPIEVDSPEYRVGTVEPGRTATFSFYVRARDSGTRVPVRLATEYTGNDGTRRSRQSTVTLRVGRPEPARAEPTTGKIPLLYLAANPTELERIRWDKEYMEILDAIRRGQYRDRFVIEARLAVSAKDISQAFLDVDPRVVHLSGHGANGDFAGVDDRGRTHAITPSVLARLFGAAADHVQCVIVNACESERTAKLLATNIDYAIGMRQRVNDAAAIEFSIGFYQALAANKSIESAFDVGCTLVEDQHIEDKDTPVLFRRRGRTG